MKLVRIAFALVVALGFGRAYAFHSGGVAECEGCHSMHTPAVGGYALLVGTDASSACLTCHQGETDTGPSGYHVSTRDTVLAGTGVPQQRTPGGDFGWLKKSYTWGGSAPGAEAGEKHGHNIIAADYGYGADSRPGNVLAPGGSYPNSQLSCVSCHDPHGQARRTGTDAAPTYAFPAIGQNVGPIMASGSYTSSPAPTATEAVGIYRILAGVGYSRAQGVTWGGFPVAIAPSTYNRTEAATDTRVSYGGMGTNSWGDWCGSCHGAMHQDSNGSAYVHPTEKALGPIANLYNAYVKSGDLTGNSASSFSSLAPFAINTTDYSVLKGATGTTAGPGTADRVTCLSCHRAHASAFPEMLRWQPGYEFITKFSIGSAGATVPAGTAGYTAMDVTGTTGRGPAQANGRTVQGEYIAAYYDRPATKFASHQRVLCNKCHAKD